MMEKSKRVLRDACISHYLECFFSFMLLVVINGRFPGVLCTHASEMISEAVPLV